MEFTELVLAGYVETLSEESDARPHADAIAIPVRGRDDLTALDDYSGELPIIATTQSLTERHADSGAAAIQLLEAAADTDWVDAIDVPYASVTTGDDTDAQVRLNDVDVECIISYRNYSETPALTRLQSIAEEASAIGGLVYIETMAATPDDTLTLLTTISEATEEGIPIGGACMGAVGRHTRIVAPLYGSKLAYAPVTVDSGGEALGYFPLAELAELIQETDEPSTPVSLHEKLTNPMIDDE